MKLHLPFLLAIFTACLAHIGGRLPASQDLDPHIYCGRRLARMLATVCDYDVKRSGSGSVLQHILAPYYEVQEQHGWPYVSSQKLKNRESYALSSPKIDSQSDWPLKTVSQYLWPLKTSHKNKESEDWPIRKSEDVEDWPWLSSHKPKGLDLPSRDKRYVVSECCEKPCTVDELISYC